MKKIMLISVLMVLMASGSVFAAALASGGLTAEGDSLYGGPDATAAADAAESVLLGKLSKGVIAGVNYISTAYAIDTKHSSGTQAFGTAADSTAIYRTNLGVGALGTVGGAPSANDNTAFGTWTEM